MRGFPHKNKSLSEKLHNSTFNMRPDQHKKKKNEQYKKKHNIKSEDSKKSAGKGKHERPTEKSEKSRSEPVPRETQKAPTQKVTNAEVKFH